MRVYHIGHATVIYADDREEIELVKRLVGTVRQLQGRHPLEQSSGKAVPKSAFEVWGKLAALLATNTRPLGGARSTKQDRK